MLKPIFKHIEIKPAEQNKAFSSSQTAYEERGTVISVADDCELIKIGMIVYFDSYLAARYEGEDKAIHWLVKEGDIRAYESLSE